ncbi:MAG: hypothetical protein ACK40O_01230 [Allosphingosinicella sp.]
MARLALLVLLIALAIAPMRMFGAGEAAAAPAHHSMHQAAAGHCAPEKAPDGDAAPQADCMTACAAIAPAAGAAAAALDPAPQRLFVPVAQPPAGLGPEAEPPPPRVS